MAVVIDVLLITLVIFLIFRGAKRGFILSLCGLLSMVIAFFGAQYLVEQFAPKVCALFVDRLELSLIQQLSQLDLPVGEELKTLLDALPEIVKRYFIPQETANQIAISVCSLLNGLTENLVAMAARETAALIAQAAAEFLVFAAAFFALMLGCRLAARFLNAVCHLPLLRGMNGFLGAIFGAIHATVLVMLFAWLAGEMHIFVSEELLNQTVLLKWLVEWFC